MPCPFVKKKGVRWKNMNPVFETQYFIDSVVDSFREILGEDYQPVVTSANDSKHSKYSEHYSGNALDFRIWGINDQTLKNICYLIHIFLYFIKGYKWVILLEKDHIHIQTSDKNIRQTAYNNVWRVMA